MEVRTMAQKKSSNKNIALKRAAAKADEKKAVKALARAEKAVDEARKAVSDSSKKLRKEALELHKKAEKLSAKHTKAVNQLAEETLKADQAVMSAKPQAAASKKKAKKALADDAAVRTPSTVPDPTVKASPLTPPLPSPQAEVPTLIELRKRAKDQKIPGYSRMNKAALAAQFEASK
jgi:hypothetical protein